MVLIVKRKPCPLPLKCVKGCGITDHMQKELTGPSIVHRRSTICSVTILVFSRSSFSLFFVFTGFTVIASAERFKRCGPPIRHPRISGWPTPALTPSQHNRRQKEGYQCLYVSSTNVNTLLFYVIICHSCKMVGPASSCPFTSSLSLSSETREDTSTMRSGSSSRSAFVGPTLPPARSTRRL
jgi:hypothetical protein